METPPTAKPTPPPKPSPLKAKELTTSERYFKENPVISRQKPPLAPKPVLPVKPSCLGGQSRLQTKHFGTQIGVSSERWEQVTHSQTTHSPSKNSRVTTVERVHLERIISTDDQRHETVVTRDASVVTSVETAACEAERIIQDTWASLQEKTVRPPSSNSDHSQQDNTDNIFLRKFIQNSSPLFSSELTNELNKVLPLKVKDCVRLTRSNSDVTYDCNNPSRETKHSQRPSLQLSPPTPESDVEGQWVLVNKENRSETKSLPSNKSLSDSSPPSNSSFLYSIGNPKLNSSSELSKPGCESSPNKLVSSLSDCDVTLRNKRPSEHSRGASWSEENEIGRSRTNSIGNESFDGSNNTVRRRISSFFGSFGKGGKTKEKRESSLFYYSPGDDSSQMESSDSGRNSMTSLNESSNLKNNNNNNIDSPSNSKQNLNVSNECCDRDSNRSSISDESFDAEQSTKSDNTNQVNSGENVDPVQRRKRKCFLIVNELMTSERVFIDVLKLLCHDFKEAVDEASHLQKSPVIPPSDFNKIINNLPQLLSLNEDLLKDIESRIETWNELPKVADVIVKKGPFLKLYSSYIQNFEAQTDFLDECCEKYRKFAQVVKDFERSDRCKKLALKHYMLKPIQRIPQYRLLLDDYLEHLDPDSPDFADTQTALKIVCDVANHANRSIKEGDHLSKLLSIQSQLGDYEIIKPGRQFVKEGELYKLCRKDMQQRFFILLSDCLLYTSYYGSMTGLKVKYKLPLAGMKVSRSHSTDCRTEFSIITSTRSFILRAKNEQECTAWVEALQTSIKDYNSRQMSFLNRQVDPMSLSNESLKIGREAPVWIQDKRVTMCQICTAEFTMTFRRHHCRACGKVVCSACSDYKAPMLYIHFNTDRVCIECYKYLLNEIDDPAANMAEVVKKVLKLSEEDVVGKMQEIRNLFKKIGQSSGKKVKKYIPQRLKEVTANDSGSQMSGWLLRKSRTRWKRLWFVLKEQVLYAYRASEDVVAIESIPVLGYNLETIPEGECDDAGVESKVLFKLVHPGQPPLVFATDSHSVDRWMSAFQEATTLK